MGWCSGTQVFDNVVEAILTDKSANQKKLIKELIRALWELDWDCEQESEYWDNPVVKEVFMKLEPNWFKGD